MHDERESVIVNCLVEAFSDLMKADPDAFRTKFRKMAADPFTFYRGSACVFYADVADREDRWADERTSRVWIQGDLHAENFGTYMDGAGKLIFDVNDFDEAFVGHFTWDLYGDSVKRSTRRSMPPSRRTRTRFRNRSGSAKSPTT